MGIDPKPFHGYPAPTSNTTYTPNQFFDVVLPHCSRGTVRLVGYMIRKTLGWCDADGNPQETQILISYNDLEKNAGINHSMIRRAIDEAVEARLITCTREARRKSFGCGSVSALYELRWDEHGEYITDPNRFRGFYAGQGNHTYIPNSFFDYTLTHETLAVIRVVGAIIRNTIGWQTSYGFRRQQVELSFTAIQRRTRIISRQTLSEAIQQAIAHNHIFRVTEGYFDPAAGKASKAAKYAIKWEDNASYPAITLKTVPEIFGGHHSENRTGIGLKTVPEDHSENRTGIEIKPRNKTFKEQQHPFSSQPVAVAVSSQSKTQAYNLLISQGFSAKDAAVLATNNPTETIQNQINWLRKRTLPRNPLGMLRRAIEENWAEPSDPNTLESSEGQGSTFARHFYAGRNGNTDEPVALPTVKDIQAAEEFVRRLLDFWPAEEKISEWGRAFGEFVRQTERGQGRTIISFVNSLRTHGDGYFSEVKAQYKHSLALAQQEHYETHLPEYNTFRRARLDEITREHPALYEAFVEAEEASREKILRASFLSPEQKQAEVRRHEQDRARLARYWRFVEEREPTLTPDFWEWDEQHNVNSPNYEKVCP